MPPLARPWFRVYTDMLDNLKVESLGDRQFRFWMKLLALANVNRPRGALPVPAVIAFRTRATLPVVLKMLRELELEGLIDRNCDDLTMHDWDEWQWDSDARAAHHRQRSRPRAALPPPEGGEGATKGTRRAETETEQSGPSGLIQTTSEKNTGGSSLDNGARARGRAPPQKGKALTEAYVAVLAGRFPGIDVAREREKYEDYNLMRARRVSDHMAAFRNWLRKAEDDDKRLQTAGRHTAGSGARGAGADRDELVAAWEAYARGE